MKLFVKTGIAVCVAVLCYFGITPTIQGSMDPPLYDRAIEAVGGFRVDEPLVLKMSFWTTVNAIGFRKANSAKVDISEIGGLRCGDQRHWDVTMKEDTIFTLTMDVVIPDNDTSGINFEVYWGEKPYPVKFPYYFVTTGPEVEVHPGKPVDFGPMPWEVDAATRRMGDSLHQLEVSRPKPPAKGVSRVYYDIDPEDSVYLDSVSESSKPEFVRMRRLEDSVWTGDFPQHFSIEGLYFSRSSGERRFRRVEGIPRHLLKQELGRIGDSIRASSPSPGYDIIIDLREPEHYAYVKSLVDSLGVTEEKGFYRTVTTRQIVAELERHHIPMRPAGRDSENRQAPAPNNAEERSSSQGSDNKESDRDTEFESQLFFEGFEGSWPGQWLIGDDDPTNGLDYWGKLQYQRVYSGDWSGWCADEGDMPSGFHYDNFMDAYMQMVNPVAMSGYINRRIRYKVYYDIESGYDYFVRLSSSDGGLSWLINEQRTGFSGGWLTIEEYLPWNEEYMVQFYFDSDSIVNFYEGVYLDDIEVLGEATTSGVNLAYNWLSHYWLAIVPSNDIGTYGPNEVFTIEPTYIDWSMRNDGATDAPPFHVGLYLDGILIEEWSYSTLTANSTLDVEDYMKVISWGPHYLKVVVDNRNEVVESYEDDNSIELGFFWHDPVLYYTGTVEFDDPIPPHSRRIARNARISICDSDSSRVEVLHSTFTDNSGWFSFPGINNATDGDASIRQDIFFRLETFNSACTVSATPTGGSNYYDSPIVYSHPSGTFDTALNYGANAAARLNICAAILEAEDKWRIKRPDPGAIRVVAASGIGTGYNVTQDRLEIELMDDPLHHYPDYYDEDVIVHEYGHWLARKYGFLDETAVDHNWGIITNPETAGKEGFCHAFAGWVWQDPIIVNHWNGGYDSNWYSLENGEWKFETQSVRTANALGGSCEGSVAGIFWDIFDGDDDDYSSASNWGSVSLPHTSDGIEDSLSDGIDNILSALLDRNVNGHHPDNITEFWEAWFQSPSFGHVQAMRDIYYEHGIDCCVGIRGNVNGDPYESIDIADLTFLAAFCFRGGPAPPCFEEGNVNGVGGIDIADVVYLNAYAFKLTGPPPPSCP